MKNKSLNYKTAFLFLLTSAILALGCKKNERTEALVLSKETSNSGLTDEEIVKIANAGYSLIGAKKIGDKYLVEGDIVLNLAALEKQIKLCDDISNSKLAKTEQYRTTNIPFEREHTVRVNGGKSNAVFLAATNTAISRYNDLGLALRFRILDDSTTKADITIIGAPLTGSLLGKADFPSSNGVPGDTILISSLNYPSTYTQNSHLATVIAHEMGHTIGFRHTDQMDRTYSEDYTKYKNNQDAIRAYNVLDALSKTQGLNRAGQLQKYILAIQIGIYQPNSEEKAAVQQGIGTIHIPGTPTGPDPNSWMLAAFPDNLPDRPFTASDILAIRTVFPTTR